jgi:hypothetical protein
VREAPGEETQKAEKATSEEDQDLQEEIDLQEPEQTTMVTAQVWLLPLPSQLQPKSEQSMVVY